MSDYYHGIIETDALNVIFCVTRIMVWVMWVEEINQKSICEFNIMTFSFHILEWNSLSEQHQNTKLFLTPVVECIHLTVLGIFHLIDIKMVYYCIGCAVRLPIEIRHLSINFLGQLLSESNCSKQDMDILKQNEWRKKWTRNILHLLTSLTND